MARGRDAGQHCSPGRAVIRMRRYKPARSTTKVTVTVVIPCYNYGHFLPQAVDSALSQQGVDVDVVIVDDCSTDGSQIVARDLARQDSRVVLIEHAENRGHIRTYNDGLAQANGEYVVLLSADDLLAPGSLARSTSLMQHDPRVGLVYGYAPAFEEHPPSSAPVAESWTIFDGTSWIGHMCRRGHNIIVNPEAIIRTSLMRKLVGYREDMPQAADMELWVRAAALGNVGRVNGPAQAYYRVHGQNMHSTDFAGVLREFQARREVFDSIGDIPSLPPALAERLVAVARRKQAREAVAESRRIFLASGVEQKSAAVALLEFARDCDQSVTNTLSWRLMQKRISYSVSSLVTIAEDLMYRVRWSLRWRRWRRLGI